VKFVVDGEKFDFDESKLTFAEARAMEKQTGTTMAELADGGFRATAQSLQAILWVAMKRQRPNLAFTDLDNMAIGDIEFIPDEEPAPEPETEADPTGAAADDGPAADAP
jgi:hypothetical protein